MAITYPRSFPAGIFLRTVKFRMVETVRTSPIANGQTQAVSDPSHFWEGEWRTNTLTGEADAAFEAWILSLANGAENFWGEDTQRCGLFRHADLSQLTIASVEWDGATVLASTPTSLNTISITAPNGLSLVPGDRLELFNDDWHHAAVIMEAATAAAEGALSLSIRPPLPAGTFSSGDDVVFSRCRVPMVLTGWSRDPRPRGGAYSLSGRSAL